MPVVVSPLTFLRLTNPANHPALSGFESGDHRYDKGVNELVRALYRRNAIAEVVVMEHEGRTAGIGAWQHKPLVSPDGLLLEDDAYIYVFGLSRQYREHCEADGKHLGSSLMTGMLKHMQSDASDGLTPASWAYIAPFNRKSHRLFAYHGYATRAPIKGHDIIRFRPPGLEPTAGGLYYRALESSTAAG